MAGTYLSLHYHIVFSTRKRARLIAPIWEAELHEYLGGIVRGLDGVPQKIGGVPDHVHLLVGLTANHRLADFVRELKKASSAWIHQKKHGRKFHWQTGYAAFSVGAPQRKSVARYIANQAAHHHKTTFLEELSSLLEKAEIEYDPQYLD